MRPICFESVVKQALSSSSLLVTVVWYRVLHGFHGLCPSPTHFRTFHPHPYSVRTEVNRDVKVSTFHIFDYTVLHHTKNIILISLWNVKCECEMECETMECDIFPFSSLTLLGDRKGILPVKNWMLVCWWWWFDWSFARLIAPVVTTNSIVLCFNKHQLTQVHLEMAVKTERDSL